MGRNLNMKLDFNEKRFRAADSKNEKKYDKKEDFEKMIIIHSFTVTSWSSHLTQEQEHNKS